MGLLGVKPVVDRTAFNGTICLAPKIQTSLLHGSKSKLYFAKYDLQACNTKLVLP